MPICEDCGRGIDYGKQCPRCKSKDRVNDMAVGDKGR